jgi:hypothetical protein
MSEQKKHRCGFCKGVNTCDLTTECSRMLGDPGWGGANGSESKWID